jgi:hypothetical protein
VTFRGPTLVPTQRTTYEKEDHMEPLPSWLNDAVAAAGIAGVYVEFEQDSRDEGDAGQLATTQH